MTEAQWLTCTDPKPILDFLKGKASERKLRLFAVACCRRIWHRLSEERNHRANVELAEQYVDGEATIADLDNWCDPDTSHSASMLATMSTLLPTGIDAAIGAADFAAFAAADPRTTMYYVEYPFTAGDSAQPDVFRTERLAQSQLLREVLGNPFHLPIIPASSWLTPAVVSMAQTIYDERSFERMSELADALVQAACTDADVLAHCRRPGPHVRGCWVIDLLLGKE